MLVFSSGILILLIISSVTPLSPSPGTVAGNSPWLNNPITQSNSVNFQIPFPTYQLSSWSGGGVWLVGGSQVATDVVIQQNYISTASLLFPSNGIGYAGWCNDANTSTSKISSNHYGSGNIYSPNIASLIIRYQMPYFVEEPLDGYGACGGWVKDVVRAYPELMTWNNTAEDATTQGFLRVDDIQFSVQIYNDLVNIYYNFLNTNPGLINLWQGIEVSAIGSDHGAFPKLGSGLPSFRGGYMYGANSIYNFATSPLCNVQGCSSLASLALSVTNGTSLALINALKPFATQFDQYTNAELLLGLSYAAYNFSINYLGGRPFVVLPSQSFWIQPSQYPYPYNISYIQGLNLLQKVEIGASAYVDNGNPPTTQAVQRDLQICSSNAPYGNIGAFLSSTATLSQWFYRYTLNSAYYEAYCATSSFMELGNIQYGNTNDNSFLALIQYGTLLNRMRNIGTYTVQPPSLTASDPSTGLSLIKGNGVALAWFYTNKTSTEHVSTTLDASLLGISTPWIAISGLDWQVVGEGTGAAIPLSLSIPARGWNPVYIVPQVPNLQPLYSNLPIVSYSISSSSASYTISGPHDFSGWIVLSENSLPATVVSSNLGVLPSFPSLISLNSSFVGMKLVNGQFQNLTQAGWYYDQINHLLYIHYLADNKASLTITTSGSSQSGSINIFTNSSALAVVQGKNASLAVSVVSFNTQPQQVTLSAIQIPSGVSVSFSPTAGNTNLTSVLLVSASPNAIPSNYIIGIQAASSSAIATTQLSLTVLPSQSSSGNNSIGSSQTQVNSSAESNTTLYTLTIASGPAGYGVTSPQAGVYSFPAGSLINITASPVAGWRLGSWYVNGNYAGNGSSISMSILSDTTVLAIFTRADTSSHEATISILSDESNTSVIIDGRNYTLPVSFSWPLGAKHNVSVSSLTTLMGDEKVVFNGWTGGIVSGSTNISIYVQGDSTIIVHHIINYKILLEFVDSTGMPVRPDMVELASDQGIIQLNNSFVLWAPGGATYTLIGAKWDGTGVTAVNGSDFSFTVARPSNITVRLNIHPQTFKVQDIFGQPIAGAEVSVQLPNGAEIQETTNSSGLAYFPQLPAQGYKATVSYMGSTLFLYPGQTTGSIQYVTFALSYPVIGGFIAVLASLGLSLSFNRLKKFIIPNLNEGQKEIKDQTTSEQ
jgi:hypothetical protein